MIKDICNNIIKYFKKTKVLFVLKKRQDYGAYKHHSIASGMYNSAKFVSDMLNENNIESKIVIVNDNNDIDKVVYDYKPTNVIIEGFWVVPDKFDVLKKLHPKVKWLIRCHSELPFLANEGVAMEWTFGYLKRNIEISYNSIHIQQTMLSLLQNQFTNIKLPFLPNYYAVDQIENHKEKYKHVIDVGCFGAIRPLKNTLIQAIAAIEFAQKHNLYLNFHINSGRLEQKGENVLKNIKALFDNTPNTKLIEHEWMTHEDFINLLRFMDLTMQVSLSETFNIVCADSISAGTPVVASNEVPWMPEPTANPTSVPSIIQTMEEVLNLGKIQIHKARENLRKESELSKTLWLQYLNEN